MTQGSRDRGHSSDFSPQLRNLRTMVYKTDEMTWHTASGAEAGDIGRVAVSVTLTVEGGVSPEAGSTHMEGT